MKGSQQGLCPVPATDVVSVTVHEDLLVGMLLDEPLDFRHHFRQRQFAGPDIDVDVVHH